MPSQTVDELSRIEKMAADHIPFAAIPGSRVQTGYGLDWKTDAEQPADESTMKVLDE